ncbi:properdin-like [Scyliorhinus torazame]|uniref:properdin-like n=1 Tax=Scyliorhinus torazame TaxID=75743 RepID=UPI003B5A8A20
MNPRILLAIGTLCSCATTTAAGKVSCFSGVNRVTGICTNLIGPNIEEEDCCLNNNYCFQNEENGTPNSCRAISQWTEWTAWSACTVSCREGVQQRRRICSGKGRCAGHEKLQTRHCIEQECCPVDGGWTSWSPWSSCSVTCVVGQMERSRSCAQPAALCGGSCHGPDREIIDCDTEQVCPTHGSWSPWGNWGMCGHTCRGEGPNLIPFRRRARLCTNPAPSLHPPGNPCPGSNTEIGQCDFLPFCAISGNWGPWADVSACSTSCGVGKVRQGRQCDNPAPKYGGSACLGTAARETTCNTNIHCPVDGFWAFWSQWNDCTRLKWNISCRQYVGQQKRSRKCIGRTHEGEACDGSIVQIRSCYKNDDCWYGKGIWSAWSDWGLCYPPCGDQSTRKRERVCEPIYPNYPRERGVQKKVPITFSGFPNFDCDELEGETETLTQSLACQNVPECD